MYLPHRKRCIEPSFSAHVQCCIPCEIPTAFGRMKSAGLSSMRTFSHYLAMNLIPVCHPKSCKTLVKKACDVDLEVRPAKLEGFWIIMRMYPGSFILHPAINVLFVGAPTLKDEEAWCAKISCRKYIEVHPEGWLHDKQVW